MSVSEGSPLQSGREEGSTSPPMTNNTAASPLNERDAALRYDTLVFDDSIALSLSPLLNADPSGNKMEKNKARHYNEAISGYKGPTNVSLHILEHKTNKEKSSKRYRGRRKHNADLDDRVSRSLRRENNKKAERSIFSSAATTVYDRLAEFYRLQHANGEIKDKTDTPRLTNQYETEGNIFYHQHRLLSTYGDALLQSVELDRRWSVFAADGDGVDDGARANKKEGQSERLHHSSLLAREYGALVSASIGWCHCSSEDVFSSEYCPANGRGEDLTMTNSGNGVTRPQLLCGLVLTASSLIIVGFSSPTVINTAAASADNPRLKSVDSSELESIVLHAESPEKKSAAKENEWSPSPRRNPNEKQSHAGNDLDLEIENNDNDSEWSPPPPPSESPPPPPPPLSDSDEESISISYESNTSPTTTTGGGNVKTKTKNNENENANSKRVRNDEEEHEEQGASRGGRGDSFAPPRLPQCHIVANIPIEYLYGLTVLVKEDRVLKQLRFDILQRIDRVGEEEERADDHEGIVGGSHDNSLVVLELWSVDLTLLNNSNRMTSTSNVVIPARNEEKRQIFKRSRGGRKGGGGGAGVMMDLSSSSGTSSSSISHTSSSHSSSSSPSEEEDDEDESSSSIVSSNKLSSEAVVVVRHDKGAAVAKKGIAHHHSLSLQFSPLQELTLVFEPINTKTVENPSIDETISDFTETCPSLRLNYVAMTPSEVEARRNEREKKENGEIAESRSLNLSSTSNSKRDLILSPPRASELLEDGGDSSPSPASPLGLRKYQLDPSTGLYVISTAKKPPRYNDGGKSAEDDGDSADGNKHNTTAIRDESHSPLLAPRGGFFEVYRRTLASSSPSRGFSELRIRTPSASESSGVAIEADKGSAVGILASFYGGRTHSLMRQVLGQEAENDKPLVSAGSVGELTPSPARAQRAGHNNLIISQDRGGQQLSSTQISLFGLQIEEQSARLSIAEACQARILSVIGAHWAQKAKIVAQRAQREAKAIRETHTTVAMMMGAEGGGGRDRPNTGDTCSKRAPALSTPAAATPDGSLTLSIATLNNVGGLKGGTGANSSAVNMSYEPLLVNTGIFKKPANAEVMALIDQHEKSARQRLGKYFTQNSVEALTKARDIEWTVFTASHKSQLSKLQSEVKTATKKAANFAAMLEKAESVGKKLSQEIEELKKREIIVLDKARRREEALQREVEREREKAAALEAQLLEMGVTPKVAADNGVRGEDDGLERLGARTSARSTAAGAGGTAAHTTSRTFSIFGRV